jgi:integrase
MGRRRVTLDRGIVLIGETVFFSKCVDGVRCFEKAPVQGIDAIGDVVRPRVTRRLRESYYAWASSRRAALIDCAGRSLKEPTFADMLNVYEDAAERERIKNGVPGERTALNTRKAFRRIISGCGLDMGDRASKLTAATLDHYLVDVISSGLAPTSAWTYISALKSIAPAWIPPYYAEAGFVLPRFEMPARRKAPPPRYVRPSQERLDAIRRFYASLEGLADRRLWLAATMMLEFAVRNGDVGRLTWGNFVKRDGRVFISYTPHKTSHSSGRHVFWPVAPAVWTKIVAMAGGEGDADEPVVDSARYVFECLNTRMRGVLGMDSDGKAAYELRKIAVDMTYQKYGAEKASALSGDDIKTVIYYYADPSKSVPDDVGPVLG